MSDTPSTTQGFSSVGGAAPVSNGSAPTTRVDAPLNPTEEQKAAPFGQVGDQVFQTQEEFLAYQAEQTGTQVGDPNAPKKEVAEEPAKVDDKAAEPAKVEDKKEEPAKADDKPAPRTDDEIKASLKAAGGIYADPKYEAAALEFERTGDVSEATLAKTAADFGVPVEVAKQFVEGQKAQRANQVSQADAAKVTAEQAKFYGELYTVAGGEAEYGKFMEWAAEGLTMDQKVAYNEALDKSPAAAKALLTSYTDAYKAAGNGGPRDITTEATQTTQQAASGAIGYASQAEMTADMAKKEYANDPAFRAKVTARVAASKF